MNPASAAGRALLGVSGPEKFLQMTSYIADINIEHLACRAGNHLDYAFGNLFTYVYTEGYAHQVSILELHPWPFVTIIQ